MDRFTFKTKDGLKEVVGVAFNYYLNSDKYIIFTDKDTFITCFPEQIEDMDENILDDNDFYEKAQKLYYSMFKNTFKNIANTIVEENFDVSKCFS